MKMDMRNINIVKKLKNLFLLKTLFSKLIASFLLVIIIISSFHLVANRIFINNMEYEITNNVDERLSNVINKFDLNIEQINKNVLLDIYMNYSNILSSKDISAFKKWEVMKELKAYLLQNEYLQEVFIITKSDNYVITSDGTFTKERFFNHFFLSDEYDEEFWLQEMDKDFVNKIYPTSSYFDKDIYSTTNQELMPIAIKTKYKAKFIIVALVDINSMANSIESNFMDGFYIYNEDHQLLYPLQLEEKQFDIRMIDQEAFNKYTKTKEGYIFLRKSSNSNLIYYKFLSVSQLKKQLNEINLLFRWIIIFSILTSVIISFYVAMKFNNPVKQLATLIQKSQKDTGVHEETVNLKYISENINDIIKKNTNYVKDINAKNSLLENFFYEAKIKNIYFHLNEVKDAFKEQSKYTLVCFKVHYRDELYGQISEEAHKRTFFLKSLIELYINIYFENAVTFQMEKNQIICLIDIDNKENDVGPILYEIKDKLKAEEEYLFFTIAYSAIYEDVSKINNVYNKVFEISKYRKATDESQILSEAILDNHQDIFYLLESQQDHFIHSLENGKENECIQQMKDILDYNHKKEVNSFYLYMLCTELINSCTKVLMKLYNEVPKEFHLSNKYSALRECRILDEYKTLCEDYIMEFTEYINTHKEESDYIVDYVKEYIEHHYNNEVYLDLLAQNLNITSSYLSSYFKNKTGINFSDYLNSYRIKQAVALLQDFSLKVKEVGVQVGITNPNTFIRLFKKYMGKTPNEYRKTMLQ